MKRATKIMIAVGVGIAALAAGTSFAQADESASLRATGAAGEQADGYLGVVGNAGASVRDQVNAINIKRRAYYTDLARKRGTTIQEVGAAFACNLFKGKVKAGDYYRLPDGVWRKSDGSIELPGYCA